MTKPFLNLVAVISFSLSVAASAAQAECSDPWLTRAIKAINGWSPHGAGVAGECNPMLYGGGHWGSYQELLNKVAVSDSIRLISGVGGKCLAVENNARSSGTRIIGWGCANDPAQFFLYRWGAHRIFDHMGYNKCLSIEGGVRRAGAQIVLDECNGGRSQMWSYLPDGRLMAGVADAEPAAFCIDLEGGSTSTAYWARFYHQRTILANCSGQPSQTWYVTRQAPGARTSVAAGSAGPVVPGTGISGVGLTAIVAAGGGDIVTAGIVAQGAGNIVAQANGNIVAHGAGDIVALAADK